MNGIVDLREACPPAPTPWSDAPPFSCIVRAAQHCAP